MRISRIVPNNRRKAFEVVLGRRKLVFPYARLRVRPSAGNRILNAFVDADLGAQAFTYMLEQGQEDTVHLDEVLDYNKDPVYLHDLLLYELTLEVQRAVAASDLSKREIIRRLGTSASQFYRLLDTTNYTKSIGQLLTLLSVLGWEVDLLVKRKRSTATHARSHRARSRKSAA